MTSRDITSIIKQMLPSISEPCSIYQNINLVSIVANVYDKPRYYIHYKADAPLNIRALFYIYQNINLVSIVANVYDKPRYYIHYKADAPLNIRALFYIYQNINLVSTIKLLIVRQPKYFMN